MIEEISQRGSNVGNADRFIDQYVDEMYICFETSCVSVKDKNNKNETKSLLDLCCERFLFFC